ncbi:MAG: hypothetical protein Q9218_007765 [Villophora microphyllina]
MAEPSTFEEFCDQLDSRVLADNELLDSPDTTTSFVETEIAKAKTKYAFMKNKSLQDYGLYSVTKTHKEEMEKVLAPKPTAQDYINAAYNFDPLITGIATGQTELVDLLTSGRLSLVPLGLLYGKYEIALFPDGGALEWSGRQGYHLTSYILARSCDGAVVDSTDRSSGEGAIKLRRYVGIGWIAIINKWGDWEKTGHVLVMDMDWDRDHHPWIILAKQWPNEDPHDPENFLYYAQRKPTLHEDGVGGMLPGDIKRTTIARLVHHGKIPDNETRPFIKQFGEGFQFGLDRPVADYGDAYHPELVFVTSWY